jgi:phosphosulfolactate synthase (CoM biosynthesis protein A)
MLRAINIVEQGPTLSLSVTLATCAARRFERGNLFETVGASLDGIKYAAGSFALMPPAAVQSINQQVDDHDVYLAPGGSIENVLRFGQDAVDY